MQLPLGLRLPTLAALLALPLLVLHAGAVGAEETKPIEVKAELWDGQQALSVITELLRFTPRSMETPGHQKTIDFIEAALAKTRFNTVKEQRFVASRPDGSRMAITNIIGRLSPDNPRRIILATHYDSIIKAYRDAKKPNAPMPGANNSASGVAVLLETAQVLSQLPDPPIGIDLVFFDGEEGSISMGAGDPNFQPVGSPYFAEHLKDLYPATPPEQAADFDMVCDRDLHLKMEPTSLTSAGAEVKKFWNIGKQVAPDAFEARPSPYSISDDHTSLQEAGIPSFIVIDFEYEPFYNTTQDTIDKCSAKSLEAVGRTLLKYLYQP